MPKTLLSLLAFIFISFYANAQFSKGSILLGGNLSYSSNTNNQPGIPEQYNHTGVYGISVGSAINENTVLGVNLNYTSSNYNNFNTGTENIFNGNLYQFGLFGRKYKSLGKEFFLFGEGGINYYIQEVKYKDDNGVQNKSTGNGGNMYIMPGISYKISKKFFLELTIPNIFQVTYGTGTTVYPYVANDNKYFSVSTSITSNPLTSLSLGFRLNL